MSDRHSKLGGSDLLQEPDYMEDNILDAESTCQPYLYFFFLLSYFPEIFFRREQDQSHWPTKSQPMYSVHHTVFFQCYCYIHILLQLLKSFQDNEKDTVFNQMTKIAKGQIYLHFYC